MQYKLTIALDGKKFSRPRDKIVLESLEGSISMLQIRHAGGLQASTNYGLQYATYIPDILYTIFFKISLQISAKNVDSSLTYLRK